MKRLIISISFLLLNSIIAQEVNVNTTWTKTFIGNLSYIGDRAVQQTSDGGFVFTGGRFNQFGYNDLLLIKTNLLGDTLWTTTVAGSESNYGISVDETMDGGFIITGVSSTSGGYDNNSDILLVKIDSLGNTEWTNVFGDSFNDENEGYAVSQTYDGGYIITGVIMPYNGDYNDDLWLIKTDSLGNSEWNLILGGTQSDVGYSVQQTNDSGYVITGMTESYGETLGYDDAWLIKTDSSGDTLWTKIFGDVIEGRSVQQTSDGGYIVVGNGGLIKTDAVGDAEWINDNVDGISVQQTTDGNYIVLGESENNILLTKLHVTTTWHVATTGSDASGDGSEANPFATIQTAIDSASDGETVLVTAGTYVENINYNGKSIVVGSHLINFPDSTDFISNTIIDGDSVASCVMMNGENSRLIGFTLKNGFTSAETFGGAITVREDSEVSNCLLVDNYNEESYYQSSIIIWGSDNVTFNHLTIFNNYGEGYANGIVWLEPSSNDTLNLSHTIFYNFEQYGGETPVENFINCYSGSEPLFCDPDNGDYTLAENSPCVGIGENSANIGAFGVGCGIHWDFSLSEPVIEVMGADDEWNPGDTISISMDFCNNTDVDHFAYPGAVLEADSNLTSLPFTGSHHWFYGISADTCYSVAWHVAADTSIVSDTIATFSAYPKTLNCDDENQGGYCIDGDTVTFEIPIIVQVVSTESEHFVPEEFTLHQNYPNPFNPVTTIQYDIPEAGEVRLDVYNILGEKVSTLASGNHEVGRYAVNWDASGMSSGMYFYRISSAKFTATKKLVLMK